MIWFYTFLYVGELLGDSLKWWLSTWWRAVTSPGSTGKLFAPVLPTRSAGVELSWDHVRASHWRESISWTYAASWGGVLEIPLPVGWVWLFFLYMTVGLLVNALPAITKNLLGSILFLCEQNVATVIKVK